MDLLVTPGNHGLGAVHRTRSFSLLFLLLLVFGYSKADPYDPETIPSGSYIINMSVVPQTSNSALKPYGLIYELLSQKSIPIQWVINPAKGKDGIDFSYGGTDFRGGPFIVSAGFRTPDVDAVIASWEALGVVGVTTTSEIVVPVFQTLTYFMNWTLDLQNGSIAEGYLINAGIPASGYNWVLPSELSCCNDIFAMPHADPTWATHERLLSWNNSLSVMDGCSGAIWAACHAVSALENVENNGQRMNFLSSDPVLPATDPLIYWGDHDNGTNPPQYIYSSDSHPVMQFLGLMDGATFNGSEQIYIPQTSWRPETIVGVVDSDHPESAGAPREAAAMVFGSGFGDPDRGRVMYEAGHSHNKALLAENIAAQRAFFNFSFWSVEPKAIKVSLAGVPAVLEGGESIVLSSSATGGTGNFEYEWTSNCAGTFSNPNSPTPTFTPDPVATPTNCVITVKVVDDCHSRTGFASAPITIIPGPTPPVAQDDDLFTTPNTPITFDALADNGNGPDSDVNFNIDPSSLNFTSPTNTGNGEFTINPDGTITYTPNPGFEGTDQVTYEICDDTDPIDGGPFCANATITVQVFEIDQFGCNISEYWDGAVCQNAYPNPQNDVIEICEDNETTISVLLNDSDPQNLPLTVSLLTAPSNGIVSVNNDGSIAYLPDPDYTGTDQFTYQVCNAHKRGLCSSATVSISMLADSCPAGQFQTGPGTDGKIYSARGDGQKHFWEYDISTNTWSSLTDAPENIKEGGASIYDGTDLYILRGDGKPDFWKYDLTTDSWTLLTPAPEDVNKGGAMTFDGTDIYAFRGNNTNEFWKYSISGNSWTTTLAAAPETVEEGGALISIGTSIYAFRGDVSKDFWRYDIGSDTWTALSLTPENVEKGGALTATAGIIYGFRGSDKPDFWSYEISSNTWTLLTDLPVDNKEGGSLVTNGTVVYASAGGSTDFYSYDIAAQTWTALSSVSNNFKWGASLSLVPGNPCGGVCMNLPANRAPLASNDEAVSACDTPVNINVQANDNDPNGDAMTTSTTLVTAPSSGSAIVETDGTITYTPALSFSGIVTFEYEICDSEPLCDIAQVTVTVQNCPIIAMDDATSTPFETAVIIDVLIDNGNGPDVDPESEAISTSLEAGNALPTNGSIVLNPDGTITYTPNSGFTGIDTFEYTACDPQGNCDVATVTVTVINDPPVAVDDSASTDECQPVTIQVLANDSDPENGILTITSITSPPSNGTATIEYGIQIIYLPDPGYTGTDVFTYQVCDSGSPQECATAVVTITTLAGTGANTAPVAVDDIAEDIIQGGTAYIAVLDNDYDPEGTSLDVSIPVDPMLTPPGSGTISVLSNGLVVFEADPVFNGTVTFKYQICEEHPTPPTGCPAPTILCSEATITLEVINQDPIAGDDFPSTSINTPIAIDVLINDVEPDLQSLEIVGTGGNIPPDNMSTLYGGTVTVNDNGTPDPSDDYIDFIPALDFVGMDTFYYQICDNGTPPGCDIGSVAIEVTPPIDLEVTVSAAPAEVLLGETTTISVTVTNASTLADASGVSISDLLPAGLIYVSDNSGGTYDPVAGNWYIGDLAMNGGTITLDIIVTVTDFDNATYTAEVASADQVDVDSNPSNDDGDQSEDDEDGVTILNANNPPVAVADNSSTDEDTPITISVLGNDTDPEMNIDPTSVSNVGLLAPSNGSISIDPVTGEITYTPNLNYNGSDSFEYAVCDDGNPTLCDTTTVDITVDPINDPPVANDDSDTTPEDTPVTFGITGNDTDLDGNIDPSTIDLDPSAPGQQTSFTISGQGTYTANTTTGEMTFTPVANFNGTVTTIQYEVCDDGTPTPIQCAQANIDVTVTPVNDPPVANDDSDTTPEDTPVTFSITGNDTDEDGNIDPSTIDLDLSTPGQQTSFTIAGQGTYTANITTGEVTFTPVADFNGTVTTIQYEVCDDGTPTPIQCAQANIDVTVTPVNDPPVANDDSDTTPEDTPVTFSITGNDTDEDGNIDPSTIDLDLSAPGQQTSFTITGQGTYTANTTTGEVTFTPVADFNGTVTTIQYEVCDDGTPTPIQCAQANIDVTVTPVNDPPVANDDSDTTPEDTPVTFSITGNDTDEDGNIDPSTIDLDPSTPGQQTSFTIAGQGTYTANTTTGEVTFTPVADFNGTVTTIQYEVCDDGTPTPIQCAQANIDMTVTPVNDPPVANDDSDTTPEDTPVTFSITGNDTDLDGNIDPSTIDLDPSTPGQQTSFTIAGQGTYTANTTTGEVTFTPIANFNGTVTTIQYEVCDDGTPTPIQCAQANIDMTVTPTNDPPAANDDSDTTPEDTPVTFSITGNDTDVDGNIDPSTIDLDPSSPGQQTSFTIAGQGTYTANTTTGEVTFTPVADFNGTVTTIQYEVCDDGTPTPIQCAQANIDMTVTPVNDPPVANDDNDTTPEDTPVTFSITGNDTDLDGNIDPSTIDLDLSTPGQQTSFTIAGQGTYTANTTTGEVTFTPVADFNGTVTTIQYEVCDDGTPTPIQCAQANIDVTVTPVNDPPVALNDSENTAEDIPVAVDVVSNDFDIDGMVDPTSVNTTGLAQPANGTTSIDPVTGEITYTPNMNFTGFDVFEYSVCDDAIPALCDTASVTIAVAVVNDPPVANDDSDSTPEDTPVNVNVISNDFDLDGFIDPGSVDTTGLLQPANGTLAINLSTGVITYSPDPDFNGTDTFEYSVCDNGSPVYCDVALVTITVDPVNDPPLVINDNDTTPEDTPITFSIIGNDSDLDGNIDPVTIDLDPVAPGQQSSLIIPGQGTYVANLGTGEVTFTPVAGFNGAVNTIQYEVCDDGTPLPALCGIANIDVTVTPVNDPPVANDDSDTTTEDTPVTFSITANDTDSDGSIDPSTIDLDPVTPGQQTSFPITGQGTYTANTTTGEVTFTPVADFNGTVTTIQYEVCDDGTPLPSQCAQANIDMTVTPVNDPPVANDDSDTTPEDTPVTFSITGNDTDADGNIDPSTIDLDPSTPGQQTSFPISGQGTYTANTTTGEVTFTPVADFNGTVTTIQYEVCDDGTPTPIQCAQANIDVTVTPVNDPPMANDDSESTTESTPVAIDVTTNDTDPDGAIDPTTVDVTGLLQPANGTISIDPVTGIITYSPNANFGGQDTFEYSVCDDGMPVLCDTALVTVTVEKNDVMAVNDDNNTIQDMDLPGNVLTNDVDPEGDALSFMGFIDPATGMLTSNPTDPVSIPGQGTITPDGTGAYVFDPDPAFTGRVVYEYILCDNGTPVKCDTAELTINVTGVPSSDPMLNEIIVNDDENISYGAPVDGGVMSNDRDPNENIIEFKGFEDPNSPGSFIPSGTIPGVMGVNSNGSIVPAGDLTFDSNGNYTFSPFPGFTGVVNIPYQSCDDVPNPNTACAIGFLEIQVFGDQNGPGNDPPYASDDFEITTEDLPVSGQLLTNDQDPNGDGTFVDVTPVSGPSNGSVVINPDGTFTYTPTPGYTGPDHFIYSICDNGTPQLCDVATAYFDVFPGAQLPIECLSFDASQDSGEIILSWTTETETNNHGFEIWRSKDGDNFFAHGWVDGSGTTTDRMNYIFIDDIDIVANQTYYYKLKQHDFDGSAEFVCGIATMIIELEEAVNVTISPNPTPNSTHLEILVEFSVPSAHIRVFDVLGRQLQSEEIDLQQGTSRLKVELSTYAAGTYVIMLDFGDGYRFTRKVIKTN